MKQILSILASNADTRHNRIINHFLNTPELHTEYGVATLIKSLIHANAELETLAIDNARQALQPHKVTDWAKKPAKPVFYDEVSSIPTINPASRDKALAAHHSNVLSGDDDD